MINKMKKLGKLLTDNLSFIFVLLGLCSFCYAAFLFTAIAGFIVTGIALGLVAYIIAPEQQ